jgi:hypothetical protein
MRRRDFIRLLGGAAAAWPLAARAQRSGPPVLGLLVSDSATSFARSLASLRQGLGDQGYIEGRNLAVEYRYADLAFKKANWFVVSGQSGESIFYAKTFFSRGQFKSFELTYERSSAALYDSLVGRFVSCFTDLAR